MIKCIECGAEISDKAAACPRCGCPRGKVNNRHEGADDRRGTRKEISKKKSKKWLFFAMPIILVVLAFCVICFATANDSPESQQSLETSYYSEEMNQEQTEIEKELEMVDTFFALNYKEILSEYPNAELECPDADDIYNLCVKGNFAGLSGLYNVCVSDDGTVWRVIFEPEDESLADKSIVDVITAALGDYIDYDSEWDYYTWKTDNLEIAYWIEDRTYIDWIGEDLEVTEIIENNNEEETFVEEIPETNSCEESKADDFLIRLDNGKTLVLETKGQETRKDKEKRKALAEWVEAVNTMGEFGQWCNDVSYSVADVDGIIKKHLKKS